jgi:cyd operon protein YbgE
MYSALSRAISLILALLLSALILLIPQAVTNADNSVNHTTLMLLLFGIMLGFIHGVGFKVTSSPSRYFFSPSIAWLIMIIGLVFIVIKTGVL